MPWLLGACGDGDPHREFPRGRPHVVVFLVDTLRADRLGAYGGPDGLTPRLDDFAAGGLTFERCVAQSNWTKPTTASLLTGQYPHVHGATHGRSVLPERMETLAELLASEGYATAAFGNNLNIFAEGTGFEQGFEVFQRIDPVRDAPFPRAELIVDAALDWLEGADPDRPFFLYLHLVDPHFPYEPPELELGPEVLALRAMGVAENLPPGEREILFERYDGEVAYVDAQFGRLMDGLERHGLTEDTLVTFVSDHGEEFFEHGGLGHHAKLIGELTHVPLLLQVPGLEPEFRGARVDEVVEQVDLYATVVDALGLTADRAGVGTSLLARALRPGPSQRQHALVETEDGIVGFAIVSPEWKYVRHWAPEPSERLYHLATDPGEKVDRSAQEPQVVEAMRALLAKELAAAPVLWELRVENRTDRLVTLGGWIRTGESPLHLERLVDVEAIDPAADGPGDGDGPFEPAPVTDPGDERHEARFVFRIAPGDRDGMVFRPQGADDGFRLALFRTDGELAASQVLLGPDGRPASELPLALSLADAERLASDGEFEPLPGELVVRLWRVLRTVGGLMEFSAEDEAILRAVGYLGDEEH